MWHHRLGVSRWVQSKAKGCAWYVAMVRGMVTQAPHSSLVCQGEGHGINVEFSGRNLL